MLKKILKLRGPNILFNDLNYLVKIKTIALFIAPIRAKQVPKKIFVDESSMLLS